MVEVSPCLSLSARLTPSFTPHSSCRVFIDDVSIAGNLGGNAYETYGITSEGATVVVRPDGYIGMVAAFDGSGTQLNEYFGRFMTIA